MNGLDRLIMMPESEKEALGIVSTPAEIAQQPQTWRSTRRIFESHFHALRSFLEDSGANGPVEKRPTVVLTGAGTSDYIGQVLTLLIRREWGCEALAIASTDLLSNLSDYFVAGRSYLCISFSRSGNSPEGIAVLRQSLERFPQIRHLIVTCNADGIMPTVVSGHHTCYTVVLDDAVNDRGLAMTSSFSNMVVFGQCLAHTWSPEIYARVFEELVRAGEQFLPLAAQCAQELAPAMYRRVCVLGSGALKGVAKESALKILEMTAGQVTTMSESVLGLRHGPMAALDGETLLVCFASSDRHRQQYEADLLAEVGRKMIVAQRIVVDRADANLPSECYEGRLSIAADLPDLYRPPVDVIFGQSLGLYFSLAHQLRPDSPSPGGVISRVVHEFQIYE